MCVAAICRPSPQLSAISKQSTALAIFAFIAFFGNLLAEYPFEDGVDVLEMIV